MNSRRDPVPKIHIGLATCGIASGALETKKAFEDALEEHNIEPVSIRWDVWDIAMRNRWLS